MKKLLMSLLIVMIFTSLASTTALAAGGQVRRENGEGEVVQVQVQDPPPFQP